jgi:predicted metalloprotease
VAPVKKKQKKKGARATKPSPHGVLIETAADYCNLVWNESQVQSLAAKDIAKKTREKGRAVSTDTIRKHMLGDVVNPQLRTAGAILAALGYEMRMRSAK